MRGRGFGLLWKDGRVAGVNVEFNGSFSKVVAKVTLDAEGTRFKLLREAGLQPPHSSLLYPAAQVEVEGADVDEDFVELFLGKRWATSFFAWIVPYKGGCRVGLASKAGSPGEFLDMITLRLKPALRSSTVLVSLFRGYLKPLKLGI